MSDKIPQTFAQVFKPIGHHMGIFIFLVKSPNIQRIGYYHTNRGQFVLTHKFSADEFLDPSEVQRWEYINKDALWLQR